MNFLEEQEEKTLTGKTEPVKDLKCQLTVLLPIDIPIRVTYRVTIM